jgi:serine/threonine protein kinase
VVKILHSEDRADPDLIARFAREARLGGELSHPNLTQIHDVSEDYTWAVMEYIDGVALDELLRTEGSLPVGLAVEVARQALSALAYLHRKGSVHRDVSPDNLMLTRDGDGRPVVKLIDLGIAKSLSGASRVTAKGLFLGKPHYASPEQAAGDRDRVDARSDLYSLGLVLYELLTGQPAFEAGSVEDLLNDPPVNLLQMSDGKSAMDEAELVRQGESIRSRCAEFGVDGTVEAISPGPVITVFEFQPAPGVKVSQIVNLQDDLALALRAESVRIDRMPGRSTLGIEVPNKNRAVIRLGSLLADERFKKSPSVLTMALGTDINGEPYYADLTTMPHLLVAGATGAGKSVGLQAMITSILYKATRDEVQFIFIDPKRIELGVYADIPHLKCEVVVDPKKAANALRWAVAEMERRYRLLAEVHVRSIAYYNRAIKDPQVQERLSLNDGESLVDLDLLLKLGDLRGQHAEDVVARSVALIDRGRLQFPELLECFQNLLGAHRFSPRRRISSGMPGMDHELHIAAEKITWRSTGYGVHSSVKIFNTPPSRTSTPPAGPPCRGFPRFPAWTLEKLVEILNTPALPVWRPSGEISPFR